MIDERSMIDFYIFGIFGRIMETKCGHCNFFIIFHLVHICISIKALRCTLAVLLHGCLGDGV